MGGNLSKGGHGEGSLVVGDVLVVDDAMEVDEAEVVKLPLWDALVKELHHRPRSITNANHNNAQRMLGGLDDGVGGVSIVDHLPICDNDQDVELGAPGQCQHPKEEKREGERPYTLGGLDYLDSLADKWAKVGGTREGEGGDNLEIFGQDLVERLARSVREEREDAEEEEQRRRTKKKKVQSEILRNQKKKRKKEKSEPLIGRSNIT